MSEAAFRAVFSNFKFVKGRGVVQVILEIPVEGYDEAYRVLGIPNDAESKWVAVARLVEG
jgi:hypothetical protein